MTELTGADVAALARFGVAREDLTPTKENTMTNETNQLLVEIAAERARQDEKWGEQNHPDGTGRFEQPLQPLHGSPILTALAPAHALADAARDRTDEAARAGTITYLDILFEEVFEAAAESDPVALRAELVQVAAVAVAFAEKIDRDAAKRHTRHLLVSECWPLSCLEGDCDHRDEDGEPEDMTVCPPTPMEVCTDCMVDAGRGEDPYHWDDCPLEPWPCSRADSERAGSVLSAEPSSTVWHFGRSWSDTRLEDACPCEKQACGLVTRADAETAGCPQHSFAASKTIRQSHAADACPGAGDTEEGGGADAAPAGEPE